MSHPTEEIVASLEALAPVVAPSFAALDAPARARFRAILADALSLRPPAVRRQLHMFLRLLELAPLPRYGRPLRALDRRRQAAVLRAFQDAPIRRLRQGAWGVKTLIFMGVYAQPELWESLGYRPSFAGNERLSRHA